LLAEILAGNGSSSVTVVMDDYTVVGAVFDASTLAPGTENLTVAVQGTDAQVTVPISAFNELGVDGVILVVSYIELDNASLPEVLAAVNVNLFTLSGAEVNVGQLVQPILITLPTAWNSSIQCAFWDELALGWASSGLVTSVSQGGLVECKVYHLTFFAAIIRGFVQTITCSKLTLLTAEGVAELGSSGWYSTPAAYAFWALTFVFAVLLLGAAAVDRRRSGIWTDEHFLIANDSMVEVSKAATTTTAVAEGCFMSCLCSFKESAALRDALDDILSNWLSCFGELRSFIEGLWEGLELNGCCSCNAVHLIMSVMLAHSARRQAAASLGISRDCAMFVLEDEDAYDLLVNRHVHRKVQRKLSGSSNGSAEEPTNLPNDAPQSSQSHKRLEGVGSLHEKLGESLEAHLKQSARWVSLPRSIWRLFLYGSPVGSAMVHCIFYSRALRVMFFMVDIFGALMLAALFFQSSGGIVSKRSRSYCESSGPFNIGESMGRLLAIGVSSMFVAGIPSMILQTLTTRAVKRFEFKGCPAWEKQLKIWRIQDRMAWAFSILYVGFCIFFIMLFLANVVPDDQWGWTVSGVVSVAQDMLIIPLSVALCIPLLAVTCLSLVSCMKSVHKHELLHERHLEMHKDHANLNLPLVFI